MTLKTYVKLPLTSIYHRVARTVVGTRTPPLLVFIPGNPGLVNYYTEYLELLSCHYPQLEILNISHAGFRTTDLDTLTRREQRFEYYDLEYQVDHKVSVIKDFTRDNEHGEKREVIIFGHSLGCYLSQRVALKLNKDDEFLKYNRLVFVGLICPTVVDIGKSNNGQLLQRLIKILPIIQLAFFASYFLKFVPAFIVRFLLNVFMASPPPHALESSFTLVRSPNTVKQALTLAKQEMDQINSQTQVSDEFFALTAGDIKIWGYFAGKDDWIHDTTRDFLLRRYDDKPNKNLVFEVGARENGIKHSFCVAQSEQFAHITQAALDELLPRLKY